MDICRSVEFVFGPGRSFTQNAETAAEGEWGRVNDREDLSSSHGLMIQAAWYAGMFFCKLLLLRNSSPVVCMVAVALRQK